MRKILSYLYISGVLIMLYGCNKALSDPEPDRHDNRIMLGIKGLEPPLPPARAAVDAWNYTSVSVAYVYAPDVMYAQSLTVTVTDNVAGQHVNTGLVYPPGDSEVSFIGYYPATPRIEVGTVTYDISKGDVDVMMSNSISGSLNAPITDKLDFGHLLTRVTFKLNCMVNQSYPEPVFGIRAGPSTSQALMTAATLDLVARSPSFKIPGSVFLGSTTGYVVPQSWDYPVIIDMMLQPGVPLGFKVATLTAEKDINVAAAGDPDGLWNTLTTVGGTAGMRYTVQLYFSGVGIIAQGISVLPWTVGNQNLGNNNGIVWY